MLKSSIHRATVTQPDPQRVGSVTVDRDLMDAADLLEGEQVTIVDVSGGARLQAHVVAGARGSGVLAVAAHLVHPGDLVSLVAYGQVDVAESRTHQARVVLVDADNRVVQPGPDPADAPGGSGPTIVTEPAETPDATRLDALICADPTTGT